MTTMDDLWERYLRGRMDHLDPSGRTGARSKEVSPCSEYTRYTVEGIFKDPFSELSVLLDMEAVGFLFPGSDMKNPKWSEALGYGMALLGDETRIHVHQNGKYVIRRAMDREDAERCHDIVSSILWPAVLSTRTDMFNWVLLRRHFSGTKPDLTVENEMLNWPKEHSETADVFGGMKKNIRELYAVHGSGIRQSIGTLFMDDQGSIMELRDRVKDLSEELPDMMKEDLYTAGNDIIRRKAVFTYHLWTHKGLGHLDGMIENLLSTWNEDNFPHVSLSSLCAMEPDEMIDLSSKVGKGIEDDIIGVYLLLGPLDDIL